LAADAGTEKPIEPSAELPLSTGARPDHTTPIELCVPPMFLVGAVPVESVKLTVPVVRAGAPPLGVTDTPNVRL
jgi:hypothetical protein